MREHLYKYSALFGSSSLSYYLSSRSMEVQVWIVRINLECKVQPWQQRPKLYERCETFTQTKVTQWPSLRSFHPLLQAPKLQVPKYGNIFLWYNQHNNLRHRNTYTPHLSQFYYPLQSAVILQNIIQII